MRVLLASLTFLLSVHLASCAMMMELFGSDAANCNSDPMLMAILNQDIVPMAGEQCASFAGCQRIDETNPLSMYLPLGYIRVTCNVSSDRLSGDNLVDGYGALDVHGAAGCPASSLEATAAIKLGVCVKASSFPFDLSSFMGADLLKAVKASTCVAGELTVDVYIDESCGISLTSYPARLDCYKLPIPPMQIINLPSDQFVSVRCPGSQTFAPTEAPCCCHSPPTDKNCSPKSEFMCLLEGGECGPAVAGAPTAITATPSFAPPTVLPSTARPTTQRPTVRQTSAPTSTRPPTAPPSASEVVGAPTAASSRPASPVNGVLVAVIIILVLGMVGVGGFLLWRHKKAQQASAINDMDLGDVLDSDSDLDF